MDWALLFTGGYMAHNNEAMKRNITRGVRAELLAAEWLIEQGIWSFIPMSAQGPIDLVGVDKDGVVHLFDIKVQARRKDGTKISRSLEELGQNEISSNTIGTMVMDALKNLDPVAYVRFASVYRNFREEKDFITFVDRIDVYKKR